MTSMWEHRKTWRQPCSRGQGPGEDPFSPGGDNIYVNSGTPYFEEEEEEEEDYENCFKEDVYANM